MKNKGILLAVVALGVAALCFAQNAPNYSVAPTDKDYRLNIKEPLEGATITGTEIQVVLNPPWVADSKNVSQKERLDTMTPVFQIWVDGKDYGNLPSGQNVFTARDLPYGQHKITVAAKNISGNLVDRKEINVTTVPPKVTVYHTDQPAPPARPAPVAAPPPPPPPAPAPEPEPAPVLPQTGTAYPGALVGGLGLLIAGLALSRRRRS